MPRDRRTDPDRLQERRQRVAHEAARRLAQGEPDLDAARRDAARQLGEQSRDALPAAAQVLDELRLRQRLFRGDAQVAALGRLRAAAIEAMEFLAAFDPRLVGRVLDGTADDGSPVQLQVFDDEPERLPRMLADHAIPARAIEARLRMPGGASERVPAWTFKAGGVDIELLQLPLALLRTRLPGDDPGGALQRASLRELRELLARDAP